MADAEGVGERSLAAKLNHLFETVVPVGRGPYGTEEVARAISSGSVSISGSYIWLLRKGQRDNPTLKHVEALARFFGVPPAYFFDDRTTQAVDKELELMVALRTAGVQHVALRAAGLSPKSLRSIKEIIEHARELEGLPRTADPE
ncbi:XRE family transcriptional regulator [Streptomyces murinus]|uniref:XRE family transcriptional regulator n=1 Tax=Streptomyces murinus TaxID=33900 RepID=UPI00211538C0|nr:XRE family transcriptional regulator [Streptomyces murinus]